MDLKKPEILIKLENLDEKADLLLELIGEMIKHNGKCSKEIQEKYESTKNKFESLK